jgi:hypothetical protein
MTMMSSSHDEDLFDEAVSDVHDALRKLDVVSDVNEVMRSYEDGEVLLRVDVVWASDDKAIPGLEE